MCGIVGLLGREEPALARRMADRIAHRGPDGDGVFVDAGVTLAHRLLAIVDAGHGHQPMTSHDGRWTVAYNGECYNHLALRALLPGVPWRTRTDTETVVEALRAWGPDALSRMEGMFALLAWDAHERVLLVARDPWGIKPLFWARADAGRDVAADLAFASEQKALLAHPDVPAVPDLDRVKEHAVLECVTGDATFLQGVRSAPPGHFALVRPGDAAPAWRPYHVPQADPFASPEQAAQEIRRRFEASVAQQLMSDVPVGVVLSGGLDSAAVAAVHQRLSDRPVPTFTVAEDESVEDVRMARRVADLLGTEHHESFFGLDDVLRDLPRHAWHNESVNYTEAFFFPLFRDVRRRATVALCGQGSDELWGGYGRYREPGRRAAQRLDHLRRARPAHEASLAAEVARSHASPAALAAWDQGAQLADFQLRLVDRNSMASSVEVRVPFLSRPLHAASRGAPWDWKLRDGAEKWVLRRALAGLLPDDLLWRPKVPAGRATSPRVMDRFEAHAARLVPPRRMETGPLAGTFARPAERLCYDLWHELYVERRGDPAGIDRLRLEDLA